MPAPLPNLSTNLSIIAALARNRVIGRQQSLPWHLSADLRRFKSLTLGHPVIMGRKTYESIVRSLGGPLPGRANIVLTRSSSTPGKGCSVADSLSRAISIAAAGPRELFVIGGAQIYRLALPLAARMYLTEIDADFAGDAFFPDFDREQWRETAREPGSEGDLPYSFVTYERIATSAG
jgi:dihydrofolate reductase